MASEPPPASKSPGRPTVVHLPASASGADGSLQNAASTSKLEVQSLESGTGAAMASRSMPPPLPKLARTPTRPVISGPPPQMLRSASGNGAAGSRSTGMAPPPPRPRQPPRSGMQGSGEEIPGHVSERGGKRGDREAEDRDDSMARPAGAHTAAEGEASATQTEPAAEGTVAESGGGTAVAREGSLLASTLLTPPLSAGPGKGEAAGPGRLNGGPEQVEAAVVSASAAPSPAAAALLVQAGSKAKGGGPPYVPPPWSGVPNVPYQLEVLKEGRVIDLIDISKKGVYMFGRSDRCDFELEHPTVSRYHAVVQFRPSGEAFLFDLTSTHGTFLNKRRVKGQVFAPLHVGDVLKFGQSTRLYVVQGPSELMPEEGLSRAERRALRHAEAARQQREEQRAAVRAVHSGSTEAVTWGMREDAVSEDEGEEGREEEEVTYENFKGRLTEHQEKLRDKLSKRHEKLGNLQREIEAIQAKETAQGGLSQGQQTQIGRNEQRIEQLIEELESLEETLNESIREMVGAKAAADEGPTGKGAKGWRGAGRDEDSADSDEDEFYDRARRVKQGPAGAARVETAASLLDQRHELRERLRGVQQRLREEEERVAQAACPRAVEEGGVAEVDSLDAFMSSVSVEIEKDQRSSLQRAVQSVERELARVGALLRVADPGGEAERKWTPKETSSPEREGGTLGGGPGGAEAEAGTREEDRGAGDGERAEEMRGAGLGSEGMGSGRAEGGGQGECCGQREGEGKGGAHTEGEAAEADGNFVSLKAMQARSRGEKRAAEGTTREREDGGGANTVVAEARAEAAVSMLLTHARGPSERDGAGGVGGPGEELGEGGARREQTGGEGRSGMRKPESTEKRRRKLGPARPPQRLDERKLGEVETWLPPADQTGDGRTSLNQKLGY